MRKIKVKDAPAFARILKKAGLKNEIMTFFAEGKKKGADQEALGLDFMWSLFVDALSVPDLDNDIYVFLGDVFEMEANEIENMDYDDFMENLNKLAKENNMANFFKQVKASLK